MCLNQRATYSRCSINACSLTADSLETVIKSKTSYSQQGSQWGTALPSSAHLSPPSNTAWALARLSHCRLLDTQDAPTTRPRSWQAPFPECPVFSPLSFKSQVWCHLPLEALPGLPDLSLLLSAENSRLNYLGGSWSSYRLELGASERICSNTLTKMKKIRLLDSSMSVSGLPSSA